MKAQKQRTKKYCLLCGSPLVTYYKVGKHYDEFTGTQKKYRVVECLLQKSRIEKQLKMQDKEYRKYEKEVSEWRSSIWKRIFYNKPRLQPQVSESILRAFSNHTYISKYVD